MHMHILPAFTFFAKVKINCSVEYKEMLQGGEGRRMKARKFILHPLAFVFIRAQLSPQPSALSHSFSLFLKTSQDFITFTIRLEDKLAI